MMKIAWDWRAAGQVQGHRNGLVASARVRQKVWAANVGGNITMSRIHRMTVTAFSLLAASIFVQLAPLLQEVMKTAGIGLQYLISCNEREIAKLTVRAD